VRQHEDEEGEGEQASGHVQGMGPGEGRRGVPHLHLVAEDQLRPFDQLPLIPLVDAHG
jgi:hypothetical protein